MKATTKDAYRLLHEGSIALSQVEGNGIRIDVDKLKQTSVQVAKDIASLEAQLKSDKTYGLWKRRFGRKTNLSSRQQLGDVLYGMMGIECRMQTGTGKPSTNEQAFSHVEGVPFIKTYFQCEKLKKLQSTYLEGVAREVIDGFLHPSFSLHLVETFRSASSNPNFQNIPVRNKEVSKYIRSCFYPRKGRYLVEIDYSGIEVRIAYCYHKDPVMRKYLLDPNTDMHRDMAMECYLLDRNEVGKDTRYCAKNKFVFPEFYGSFYAQCAPSLWEAIDLMNLKTEQGVPLKQHLAKKGIKKLGDCSFDKRPDDPSTFVYHIQQVEKRFWGERFKVYAEWKKSWMNAYLDQGWFDLYTGFRVRGVYKRNKVINYPVQGAAFHCLLWSLIRLQKWLNKNRMKSLIVGQIHDSMILDCTPDEIHEVLSVAKRIMTKDLPKSWDWICIPLDVEVEVAPLDCSWYEKQVWTEEKGKWQPKAKK